jgi:CRISPR-associated endonuclease/helicase Cas3
MPNERTPEKPVALFARGVWQDDLLPEVDLGDGVTTTPVKLDLSPMLLGRVDGQPSWVERILSLRDGQGQPGDKHPRYGPIKLAYLEAVLRAADMRVSEAADKRAKGVQS